MVLFNTYAWRSNNRSNNRRRLLGQPIHLGNMETLLSNLGIVSWAVLTRNPAEYLHHELLLPVF